MKSKAASSLALLRSIDGLVVRLGKGGKVSRVEAGGKPVHGVAGPGSWANSRVHGMDADPIFVDEGDIDAAREIVDSTEQAELFLYPGDQHYFADSSLPSYDAEATALLTRRVLDFLETR